MWLTGIIIFLLIMLFIQWLCSSPMKWRSSGITWLLPWPLVGNTFSALTNTYYSFWLDFYRKYKNDKLVGFHFFNMPSILIRDPELVKHVLMNDADSYTSRGLVRNENDPFSKNLLVLSGDEWKITRAKMTPYFSPARVRGMLPVVEMSITRYSKELMIRSKYGPVDVDDLSMKLATDVVVSSAFGLHADSFSNPNSFFFKLQRELLGFLCGFRILVGFLSPFLYCILGFMLLSRKTTDNLHETLKQIVKFRSKGEGVRPDFIQGMIELYNKDSKSNDADGTKVAKFDLKSLVSQCMIMFAAGTDSTGHTLGFVLYELAMNQYVQDRLRAEILEVQKNYDGVCGYDQLAEMPYLEMVYLETLRKYPPVSAMGRKCTTPTIIDNLKISKGTFVAFSIVGLQNDPQYHINPEKFDPERFAPGKQIDLGTYLPFGLGPRACFGIRLAQIEIKLSVCEVLSKFELIPTSETPKVLKFGFGPTLAATNGIKLLVKPLK